MKKRLISALSAYLAVFPVHAAAENPGTTAAPVLQLPLGARAYSMGGAFTAVADDISTLHYNPAGLSNLNHRELTLMYLRGLDGQNLEYIAGGTPLAFSGLIGEGYASLASSLLFSQNGAIEVNTLNADGSLAGSESLSAGGDLVFTLGYSERAGDMEFQYKGRGMSVEHLVGVSGKIIRSTLAQRYSATALAADLGYHVQSPEAGFKLGVSALNLGTSMKFVEEADPLPLTLRAGMAYLPRLAGEAALTDAQTVLFAADVDYLTEEKQWHLNAGVEYSPVKNYSARLGYQFNRDVSGLTFGFGGDFKSLRLAYAWGMQSALSDVHRFSITYRFGHVPGYKRQFQRRPYIESMPEREELKNLEEEKPRELDPPRRPRRQVPESRRGAPGWIY